MGCSNADREWTREGMTAEGYLESESQERRVDGLVAATLPVQKAQGAAGALKER